MSMLLHLFIIIILGKMVNEHKEGQNDINEVEMSYGIYDRTTGIFYRLRTDDNSNSIPPSFQA